MIGSNELEFWEYTETLEKYKKHLKSGEAYVVALPAIEPISISWEGHDRPDVDIDFPSFEFKIKYSYDPDGSADSALQGMQVIDRLRFYLIFTTGRIIPISAWLQGHDFRMPLPWRRAQPLHFHPGLFDGVDQEELNHAYLSAYENANRLMEKIERGDRFDTSIRSFGRSFTEDFECAFVGLWRTLEILILARGEISNNDNKGKVVEIQEFLNGIGQSIELSSIQMWRKIRNEIIHGRSTDKFVESIFKEIGPLKDSLYKVLAHHTKEHYGVEITRIVQ